MSATTTAAPGGPGLADRVRTGSLWSAGGVIGLRLANIVVMAVVARLVVPSQFGVFTVAVTVHSMVSTFSELGASSAIARNDLPLDEVAPSVTTLSVVTSATLGALMALTAPWLGILLGVPESGPVIRVMAIAIALTGVFAVPGAQLQREFKQKRVFAATSVSFLPSALVLVVSAWMGGGAMAFAWSRVVGQLVAGLIMVGGVAKVYLPGLRRAVLPRLLSFGLPLAAANLLSQLLLNLDFVMVGSILGALPLGLYTLAFNVASWAKTVLGSVINGMALPAISQVRHEGGDVPGALGAATRTVCCIGAPISFLTLAMAHPIVVTLYGRRWEGAVPVLQALAIYGLLFVVGLLYANVLIAMGRTGLLLTVQIAGLGVLWATLWAGIRLFGITGAGIAQIVTTGAVTLPVYLWAVRRSTGFGPARLVGAAWRPVIAGMAAGLVAAAVGLAHLPDPLHVVVGGALGGLVYLGLTWRLLAGILPDAVGRRVRRLFRRPLRAEGAG